MTSLQAFYSPSIVRVKVFQFSMKKYMSDTFTFDTSKRRQNYLLLSTYTGWSKSLCAPDDYSTLQMIICRWPSQNIFGMWTVLYWTPSSRTHFGLSINASRLAGDTLNINLTFCIVITRCTETFWSPCICIYTHTQKCKFVPVHIIKARTGRRGTLGKEPPNPLSGKLGGPPESFRTFFRKDKFIYLAGIWTPGCQLS
jgi:hypothetical protein